MVDQLSRAAPLRVRPSAGFAAAEAAKVPYAPGLDGLRGLAVLGVLAYHLDLAWAGGGFLGVEVFFTLSGFLVTQLLVTEARRRGRIDAKAFFLARARRLVPALVAGVLGTLLVFHLLVPEGTAELRADALASLGYVQNWHLVIGGVPYGEAFERPSPFLHLWSLSVEGQLYLLWPLLFIGVLATWGRRRSALVAAALALASAGLMAWRFDPDNIGLVYYATDTRASGFLLGAMLALLWTPERWSRRLPGAARAGLDVAGLVALVALVVAFVSASEFSDELYERGGFLRVGLASMVVVLAATRREGLLGALLGRRLLVWIGQRSYGIYLYHWPILVLTRPEQGSAVPGWLNDLGRIALTLVVVELSYRFLETPIRRGGLRRMFERMRASRLGLTAVAGAAAVATFATVVWATGWTWGTPLLAARESPSVSAVAVGQPEPAAALAETEAPAAAAEPAPAAIPHPSGPAYVLGDSIALGSAEALKSALGPGTTVDGKVGRQFSTAPAIVEAWATQNPGPVVVNLGANGTVDPDDVQAVLSTTGDRPVVLVGVSVPRRWQDGNNAVLRSAAAERPDRVHFVDWAALVAQDPSILGPDDVHPTARGRQILANAVRAALPAG